MREVLDHAEFKSRGLPKALIARTVKGKGIPMMEGHGFWHHRIPSDEEYAVLMRELA